MAAPLPRPTDLRSKPSLVVGTLGITQILAWGSSYYLPAVLAGPIATDTGWPLAWVVGGLSLGLLVSGLVSPHVGRLIERHGGRPVLAASAVLLALGLALPGLGTSLPLHFLAWAIIGCGMGVGLYDAAFATLGRPYGREARRWITNLTLYGGFASTICWPLSALLVASVGWRGACLGYAATHLAVTLPAYLTLLPPLVAPPGPDPAPAAAPPVAQAASVAPSGAPFLLLAAGITLGAVIASVVSVHLLTILQAGGMGLAAAVALGALVGPAQVAARIVEKLGGDRWHPVWTMLASHLLVTTGLGLLALGGIVPALALILYGAGIGIKSIARGTLPLALFGSQGYVLVMRRLAMPALVAQALSPTLGAHLLGLGGAGLTMFVLAAGSATCILLTPALLSAVQATTVRARPV